MTFYGNKNTLPPLREPWANPDLPMFIGNKLRACNFVGFEMAGFTFQDTHIITAWGDDGTADDLQTNGIQITVTDSDDELAGPGDDVRSYTYSHNGDDWYLPDYDVFDAVSGDQNPFIMNVVTLSEPDYYCSDDPYTAVGSYQITQHLPVDATGLQYEVGTNDRVICVYETVLTSATWQTSEVPQIVKYYHDGYDREHLDVEWEFTGTDQVPMGTTITIDTEFLLPAWNTVRYENVQFNYLPPTVPGSYPSIGWKAVTPDVGTQGLGGYLIAAWELYDETNQTLVGRYRAEHEYGPDQDADFHTFVIDNLGTASGFVVRNLTFGGSDHLLDHGELWAFDLWQQIDPERLILPGQSASMIVNWGLDVPGDVDSDRDLDLLDYAAFIDCAAGDGIAPEPTPPMTQFECLSAFDEDGDLDVDAGDWGGCVRGLIGPS